MGQSFHWMDEQTALNRIYKLIEPGGGVIIVGSTPMSQNKLSLKKDMIIKELILKYLGSERRAGKYIYKPTGQDWETELFPNSAFSNFEKQNYVVQVTRSIDQVIGNLFSMSWSSEKLLGKQAIQLGNELRRELSNIGGRQKFTDRVQFTMYILHK
jgi:hypothetical protein